MTLRQFFLSHVSKPFPTDGEKRSLATETQLEFKQVSDWFTNTRKRFWRPYSDHLEMEGCALAKDPEGKCKCSTVNKSKKKGDKAAAAAAAAAAATGGAEGSKGPEHDWLKMWA
jgi:hypothetical protein